MSQNQSPPLEKLRNVVKQNFPHWQGLAASVIDRACCFSSTTVDMDDFDQDNSIVWTAEATDDHYSPRVIESKSQSETTNVASNKEATPKKKNTAFVFMDNKRQDELFKPAASTPTTCSGNTVATSVSHSNKSQASWASSVRSIPTCSTIAWDDFEEDFKDEEDCRYQSESKRDIPLPTVSSKTFTPRGHVRRWSGVEKDTANVAPSDVLYYDVRRVQSECRTDFPPLSGRGYEC